MSSVPKLPWEEGLRSSGADPGRAFADRECSPNIIEVATKSWDPDRQGTGASWMSSDPSSARLFVPQEPTTSPELRYIFALCGVSVPAGQTYHLIGYRQKVTIGAEIVQGQAPNQQIIVKEIPVTTPDWAFPDGNVTTMFRFIPGNRPSIKLGNSGTNAFNQGPARTQDPYGTFTGLLWLDTSLARYTPPSSGQPPGFAIDGVTDVYDVRNPWNAPKPIMRTALRGPGDLVMYMSVRQSNANTRPVWAPPPGFDLGAVTQEDRFVLAFPQALYRHVGGAMIVDTGLR